MIKSMLFALTASLCLTSSVLSQSPSVADYIKTDFALPAGATTWSDLSYLTLSVPNVLGYVTLSSCISMIGCEVAEALLTLETPSAYTANIWDGTVIADDLSKRYSEPGTTPLQWFPVGTTFTIKVNKPVLIFNVPGGIGSTTDNDWLYPDNTVLPTDFRARYIARCP